MNSLATWLRNVVVKPLADRRQSPRFPFKASIEVRTAAGAIWRGVARDISARGLGAVVYADLQVGDSVMVKYAHPDGPTPSQLVARAARIRSRFGWRYGFEFQQDLHVNAG